MRVLFVAARFPFPPWRGDQARAFHQLRLLAGRHAVTLLAPGRGATPEGLATLRAAGVEVVTVASSPWALLAGVAHGLRRGLPFQVGLFATRALRRRVTQLLAERRHDIVHAQLVRAAAALPERLDLPLVVDLTDALSLNLRRRAEHESGPLRVLFQVEARRLLACERALCARATRVTVVSADDHAAIGAFPALRLNRNGVDLARFRPPREARDPRRLVFSGNLGYFPSADAARFLASEILPRIWRDEPGARLALVGARPSRALRDLERRDPRIELHADVADVAPFLASAALAVLPLRAGSGQLFKALEALACATPVVATPRALAGLAVEHGRHVLAAESAGEIARAVVDLLRDPQRAARLGEAGRAYVSEHHAWETVTADLESIWREAAAQAPVTSA